MKEALISIIVPVYNAEKYICRCVKSIIDQSYKNLEIILVDDGSTDGSGGLIDELARNDSRIIILHQKNQGCSIARNNGLDICKGSYVCIVDADDYLHPEYVKYLYKICTENSCDMAICGHCVPTSNDESYHTINWNSEVKIYKPRELFDLFYSDMHGSIVVCWNKIYKRECIGDIRYYPGILAQDEATTFKMIYNANQIAYSKEVLYYYYSNPESVTKVYGPKRLGILTAYECRIEFYKEHDEKGLLDREYQFYLSELLNNYYKVFYQLDKNQNILDDIMKRYDKVWETADKTGWTHTRIIMYYIFRKMPILYGILKNFRHGVHR